MNRLALSIALVAAAATPFAFADGAERETPVVQAATDAGPTRAQVRAEAAEARRLGVTVVGEATPVVTPAQQAAIRLAGERASGARVAGVAR